jgi:hypothetical protein
MALKRSIVDQEALNFGSQSAATTVAASTRDPLFYSLATAAHLRLEVGDDDDDNSLSAIHIEAMKRRLIFYDRYTDGYVKEGHTSQISD